MDNTSMTYVDTSLQHSTIRGQKEKENKKRKTTTKKVFHPNRDNHPLDTLKLPKHSQMFVSVFIWRKKVHHVKRIFLS
jgi:hypothetical protein